MHHNDNSLYSIFPLYIAHLLCWQVFYVVHFAPVNANCQQHVPKWQFFRFIIVVVFVCAFHFSLRCLCCLRGSFMMPIMIDGEKVKCMQMCGCVALNNFFIVIVAIWCSCCSFSRHNAFGQRWIAHYDHIAVDNLFNELQLCTHTHTYIHVNYAKAECIKLQADIKCELLNHFSSLLFL